MPWEFVSVYTAASGSCRPLPSRLSCQVILSQQLSLLLYMVTVVTAPQDLPYQSSFHRCTAAHLQALILFFKGAKGHNNFQLALRFLKHDWQADTLLFFSFFCLLSKFPWWLWYIKESEEERRRKLSAALALTGRAKKPCEWLNSGILSTNVKPRCWLILTLCPISHSSLHRTHQFLCWARCHAARLHPEGLTASVYLHCDVEASGLSLKLTLGLFWERILFLKIRSPKD